MTLFLLNLFAFLRPIFLLEFEQTIFGFGVFDLAAIAFIGILFFSIMVSMVIHKKLDWSAIDLLMFLYIFWCIAVSSIYPDQTYFKELIKWVTPFLTWFAVKNLLHNRHDYLKLILFLMSGIGISIIVSSIYIFLDLDTALDKEIWATKQIIYEGAFGDSHYLGQVSLWFLYLGAIYAFLVKTYPTDSFFHLGRVKLLLFFAGTLASFYCLYYSSVRTAYVGLLIFFVIFFYYNNKKFLFLGGLVFLPSVLIFMIYTGSFEQIFHDFIEVSKGERSFEKIGSGRPFVWHHNLMEFSKVTFDRQIAGIGIGNKVGEGGIGYLTHENFWPSHNDFLAVLIYTGIVGLFIFLVLQFAFFKSVLSLQGQDRYVFLALLLSVWAMTFADSSYVSFYGLAQIYYLVFSYIELESKFKVKSRDHNTTPS
jgi:O-antigen ligase